MAIHMTPRKLKAWRRQLDMTQADFGTLLGVSRSTVNRWEGGTQAIPHMVGLLESNGPCPASDAIVAWALTYHWEAVADHLDLSDEALTELAEEVRGEAD